MPETLYIKLDAVDNRPLEDGLLAILNNEATDARRYFELVSLRVSPSAPTSNITAAVGRSGAMSIRRITALSGGDSITPIRMDTADSALPSQVLIRNNPASATLTDVLRRVADAPTYNQQTSLVQFSARTYGGSMVTHQKSHYADIWRGGENADVETIILREGQGVALVQDEYGTQHSMQTSVLVTNIATGATYICRSVDLSTDRRLGEPNFGIFNGSGSGVVLSVKLWVLPMDGEAVLTPPLRLCRIGGIALGGDAVTPILADTSKSVPSALQVLSGPFQPRLASDWQPDYYTLHGLDYSASAAAYVAWMRQQIGAGTFTRATKSGVFRALGEVPSFQSSSLDDDLIFWAEPGSGIVIAPGDGIALVGGRDYTQSAVPLLGSSSTFINFDIEAVLLHYPPPAAGGNTYSKTRVVNVG